MLSLHGVEVVIDSDKNPISVTILHDAFKAPPSGRGYEKLEIKNSTKNIIEGKIYTSKVNEFFGTTYEYDLTFSANILRYIPPTENEKIEAASSEQAAIYRKYERCIIESDFEGLKNLVVPDISSQMSREEAGDMFEFMQMTMPVNVKFLRLTRDDQKAILEMAGEIDDQEVSGKSNFHFIDNEWKIGETSWSD